MTEPTLTEYPFQVGQVVYQTKDQAKEAIQRAKVINPKGPYKIIDRRTGKEVK